MSIKIECILDCQNHLGEGPVWDVDEGRLYWVDGTGRRVGKPELWRMDPKSGKVENWTLGEHDVGAMALRAGGGAVMALDDGFYFFDYDKAEMELITKVDPEQPRTRLNDGKCDRRGALLRGRHGRQGGAHHLRPVAARPRPQRHQGGWRHHLHQRPLLEPGRQDLLPRRQLPGGVLGLRLQYRDGQPLQQAGVRLDQG